MQISFFSFPFPSQSSFLVFLIPAYGPTLVQSPFTVMDLFVLYVFDMRLFLKAMDRDGFHIGAPIWLLKFFLAPTCGPTSVWTSFTVRFCLFYILMVCFYFRNKIVCFKHTNKERPSLETLCLWCCIRWLICSCETSCIKCIVCLILIFYFLPPILYWLPFYLLSF